MHKLILLILPLFFTAFIHAEIVNGIAIIVEGEAITTSEIRTLQQKSGLSKEKTIDLLIQDRLQKVAMKEIKVTENAIDEKIKKIASLNNLSLKEMQKRLKESGMTWAKYRSSIKENLKKEKFFKSKISTTVPSPSEDELRAYYKKHPKEFVVPEKIALIEYSAKNEKAVNTFLKTASEKGIKSRSLTKRTKDMNPTLFGMFLQTPDGSFTRTMNAGDKYICYKVLSKEGRTTLSFDAAKNAVSAKWRREQQNRVIKDYFEKMKINANIQVIRK